MALKFVLFCSFELLVLFILQIKAKAIKERDQIGKVKCISLKIGCMNDMDCYASAMTVNWFCQGLFYGRGDTCSEDCKYELGNFTSKDSIGRSLATCSCENDALCLTYRARGLKCFNNNMKSNRTGCSSLLWKCKNDVNCSSLWENFLLKCTHLISGTECTEECKSVMKKLYSHRLLTGYEECECDGYIDDEKFCRGVRAHYDHLCKPQSRGNEIDNTVLNTVEIGTRYQRDIEPSPNVGDAIKQTKGIYLLIIPLTLILALVGC